MARMGRPPTEIDLGLAERLGRIGCTHEEIASVMNIPLSTLEKNHDFQKAHKKGMQQFRISLRRLQWRSAVRGSIPMQIFLGKNNLGQSDRPRGEDEEVGALTDIAKALQASRKKHNI